VGKAKLIFGFKQCSMFMICLPMLAQVMKKEASLKKCIDDDVAIRLRSGRVESTSRPQLEVMLG
jgi:hypothetical protein